MGNVFSGTTLLHYKENVFLELILEGKAVAGLNIGFSFRFPHVLSYQETLDEAAAFAVGKARAYNSAPIIMEGPLVDEYRDGIFSGYLKLLPLDAIWKLRRGLDVSEMPYVNMAIARPEIIGAQRYFERSDDPLSLLAMPKVNNEQRSLIVVPANYSDLEINKRQLKAKEASV